MSSKRKKIRETFVLMEGEVSLKTLRDAVEKAIELAGETGWVEVNLGYGYLSALEFENMSVEYDRLETIDEFSKRMEKNRRSAETAKINREKRRIEAEQAERDEYERLKEKYES